MRELDEKMSENLGKFLMEFEEDVVKGLQKFFMTDYSISLEMNL